MATKTTKTKKPRGRPKSTEDSVTLSLRFPVSMVEALDAYCEALSATLPGMTVSRNDAIRRLVALGLQREAASSRL